MMKKTISIITGLLFAGMSTMALAHESINCDAQGLSWGSRAWGQCYENGAVDACKTGNMIQAPSGCPRAAILANIINNVGAAHFGCSLESRRGYLPVGESVSTCVTDMQCYARKSPDACKDVR